MQIQVKCVSEAEGFQLHLFIVSTGHIYFICLEVNTKSYTFYFTRDSDACVLEFLVLYSFYVLIDVNVSLGGQHFATF